MIKPRTPYGLRHTAALLTCTLALAVTAWADDAQQKQLAGQPAKKTAADGKTAKPIQRPTPAPQKTSQELEQIKLDDQYNARKPNFFTEDMKPKIRTLITHKFDDAEFRIRLKMASRALDEWAKRVEEYGSVTMSSPILTREQGGFAFNITDGAQEFYTNAKTRKDGSAAATLAIANQFSLAGQATFDPLAKAQLTNSLLNANGEQQLHEENVHARSQAQAAKIKAAELNRDAALTKARALSNDTDRAAAESTAYKNYSDAISPATVPPIANTVTNADTLAPSPLSTAVDENRAKANLDNTTDGTDHFLNIISNLGGNTKLTAPINPTVLPDRVAMIDAAGTNTVKAIFQILGHPEEAMKFKDKQVLFATVAVGVNPGWRTRTDFSAEITGQASYRLIKARTDTVWALRDRLGDSKNTEQLMINHQLKEQWDKLSAAERKTVTEPKVDVQKQIREEETALAKAKESYDTARKKADQHEQAVAQLERLERQASGPVLEEKLARIGTDMQVAANKEDEMRKVYAAPNFVPDLIHGLDPLAEPRAVDPTLTSTPETNENAVKKDIAVFKDWPSLIEQAKEASCEPEYKALLDRLNSLRTLYWAIRRAEEKSGKKGGQPLIPPTLGKTVLELIENTKERDQLCKQKVPEQQGATTAKNEAIDQLGKMNEHQTTIDGLKISPLGGVFGSGEGGGDLGNLRVHKEFFDRVTLHKQPPLVAGISPLMESQVLDLKDSYGRQDQVAIALAAAMRQGGAKASAQVFDRFMRQQTKTAGTLSSLPVVNTFSASGGLFGFQVGPRLRALNDPAARKGGSANVIDRQSFPAVLIMGFDRADLSPVICLGHDGKYYVFEPELVIRQSSRWNPLDRKLFSFSKNDWWNPLDWHNPRYSERDRTDNMINVADQFRDLEEWLKKENEEAFSRGDKKDPNKTVEFTKNIWDDKDGYDKEDGFARHAYVRAVESLVSRRDALTEMFIGSECRQYLPQALIVANKLDPTEASEPKVGEMVPASLTIPLPASAVNNNALQVAQLKGSFVDAHGLYATARETAKAASKVMRDAITATTATPKALSDLVTKTLPAPETGKPAPVVTDAMLNAMSDRLKGLADMGSLMDTAINNLDSAVDSLKTAVTTGTQPKPEDIGAQPAIINDRAGTVETRANAIPVVPAELITILRGVNIDRDSVVKTVITAKATVASLASTAATIKGVLDNLPPSDVVPIVILGQNLNTVTKIEASVPRDVLEWAQPNVPALNLVKTVVNKDSIQLYVRAKRSATIHFRLTFTRKDPNNSAVTIERQLYTPPVILTYSSSPPAFSGGGYVAINVAPAPIAPEAPVEQLAIELPAETGKKRVASRTARSAKGVVSVSGAVPDFSRELFPPLPEK